MEKRPFLKGQAVTWCGVEGVIYKIDIDYIHVDFGNRFDSFYLDGKYCNWHKEPSLFHVEDKVDQTELGCSTSGNSGTVGTYKLTGGPRPDCLPKPKTRKIEHWEHVYAAPFTGLIIGHSELDWEKTLAQIPYGSGIITHLRSTLIETFEITEE